MVCSPTLSRAPPVAITGRRHVSFGALRRLCRCSDIKLVQRPPSPLPITDGAQKIAAHYRFTLTHLFDTHPRSDYVIVVEDDMIFSKDFLLFFSQTAALY